MPLLSEIHRRGPGAIAVTLTLERLETTAAQQRRAVAARAGAELGRDGKQGSRQQPLRRIGGKAAEPAAEAASGIFARILR